MYVIHDVMARVCMPKQIITEFDFKLDSRMTIFSYPRVRGFSTYDTNDTKKVSIYLKLIWRKVDP